MIIVKIHGELQENTDKQMLSGKQCKNKMIETNKDRYKVQQKDRKEKSTKQ